MSVNISPSVWGPRMWKTLHTIAFAYPEVPTAEQQQAALSFLTSLAQLLPCQSCRTHFAEYLAKNPPTLGSREQFAKYLNQFHNAVNTRIGKPTVPYDSSRAYGKDSFPWIQIVLAVILGIAIGFLLSRQKVAQP